MAAAWLQMFGSLGSGSAQQALRPAPQRISLPACARTQTERDCEALRGELNKVAAHVAEQEAAMAEQRAAMSQLQGTIAESDQVRRGGHGGRC